MRNRLFKNRKITITLEKLSTIQLKIQLRITSNKLNKILYYLGVLLITPMAGLFFWPILIMFTMPQLVIQIDNIISFDLDYFLVFLIPWIISITLAITPVIYIIMYRPLGQIEKFKPYTFIDNYHVMKWAFPIHISIFTVLALIYHFNLTEMFLPKEYSFLIWPYLIYFLISSTTTIQFFIVIRLDTRYLFALSKAYCLEAKTNTTQLYKLKNLIKCIKSYNLFLEKELGVFFDIKNDEFLNFIDKDPSKEIFLDELLDKFKNANNKNEYVLEPKTYISEKFPSKLSQITIKNKIVRLKLILTFITYAIGLIFGFKTNLFEIGWKLFYQESGFNIIESFF